jgi:hypothetical protein
LALAGCDALFLQKNALAPDAGPEGTCAPEFNSGRYVVFTRSVSWLEAEETCRSLQGDRKQSHLAVITDKEEARVVGDLFAAGEPWVGLTTRGTPKDQFHWITREPAGTPWLGSQPDDMPSTGGLCGRIVDGAVGLGLADDACTATRDMVCECDDFPVDTTRL